MIDHIFSIILEHGHFSYGEEITQLEHVLQCGQLAREDGAPDALIAAALLHDIGQFIGDAGHAAERLGVDVCHEITGARFLAKAFPETVTEPVRMHVDAKRYLCAVEPGYGETLSEASRLSLRLQGGPMSGSEATAFEKKAGFENALRLRRYDDLGKRPNWIVPDLESYRVLLRGLMIS